MIIPLQQQAGHGGGERGTYTSTVNGDSETEVERRLGSAVRSQRDGHCCRFSITHTRCSCIPRCDVCAARSAVAASRVFVSHSLMPMADRCWAQRVTSSILPSLCPRYRRSEESSRHAGLARQWRQACYKAMTVSSCVSLRVEPTGNWRRHACRLRRKAQHGNTGTGYRQRGGPCGDCGLSVFGLDGRARV